MYVCMYVCMYICVCTFVRTYVCTYVCMYLYVCMYVCVCFFSVCLTTPYNHHQSLMVNPLLYNVPAIICDFGHNHAKICWKFMFAYCAI